MPTNEYDDLGGWVDTFYGNKVFLKGDNPDELVLADILHGISQISRFTGHTTRIYTVGEHSLLVAEIIDSIPEKSSAVNVLHGIMHDWTEFAMNDVSAPLKPMLGDYKPMEKHLWSRIANKFGVPVEMDQVVKDADWIALYVEAKCLCPHAQIEEWACYDQWGPYADAWIESHGPVSSEMPHPKDVRDVLLTAYTDLKDAYDAEVDGYNATDLLDDRL